MTIKRKLEILEQFKIYILDHCNNDEEKIIAFKNIIGLTDEEIKEFKILNN